MSIVTKVLSHAVANPERIAFYQKEGPTSYGEFADDIRCIVSKLAAVDVKRDDFIMVVATNDYEFICTYFAIHLLGAVVVSIAPDVDDELRSMIHDTVNPALIIESCAAFSLSDNDFGKIVVPSIGSDSPSEIIFTSGTTGEPKGVVLTHSQIVTATKHIISHVKNNHTDIELLLMPLSHSFGMARMRSTLYAGGALVLGYPITRLKNVFKAIEEYKVTGLGLVPSAWKFITQMSKTAIAKYSDQIKYIEFGSASLLSEDKKCLTEWFPHTHIVAHYGSTEVSRALYNYLQSDDHQSVGRLSRGAQVAIVDDNKVFVSSGKVGEIVLKAPWMFSHYFNYPELTEDSHVDGYLRSGDQGYIAGDYLFLTGRIKEIINVGGKKFSPYRIEDLLNKCDFVKESACTGHPDDSMGELVHAFVVLEIGANVEHDKAQVLMHDIVASKLPVFMRPNRYTFLKELPKTSIGKIKRLALNKI